MGAVTHTTNIRLSADDLTYIVNHAGDKVMLVDPDLVPILEPLAPALETVEHFVIMTGDSGFKTSLPSAHIYEELLDGQPDTFDRPPLDENDPGGAVLHLSHHRAAKGCDVHPPGPDTSCDDGVFRRLRRGAGAGRGDGRGADVPRQQLGRSLFGDDDRGDAGVDRGAAGSRFHLPSHQRPPGQHQPGRADHLGRNAGLPFRTEEEYDLSCLRMVVSGGSAVPRSMIQAFKERLGIELVQAYGMTEATPLVSFNRLGSHLDGLGDEERLTEQGKQGTPVYGVEMRLVDEDGADLPWDGEGRGELLFRGPWIASEYLNDPRSEETFIDGWYHSGDIASLDPWGNIQMATG